VKELAVYRMSSVGRCPRALSAIRQGYTPESSPVWLETAAEEGKWHEQRIKDELRADDIAVYGEQQEVILEYPDFVLLGHIDGIVNDHGTEKLLEIKSMSQFEFDRWMRDGFAGFHQYADQLTCYMHATGLEECLYIVKNRSSGYENRQTIKAPSDMAIIEDKIKAIEDYLARWIDPGARDGTYPADFDPNSLECRRCEYKSLCAPEQKELTPIEEAGLRAATEDWRRGKALVAEGQELVDKAKEIFEVHTKATGIDKWRFAELAIVLIKVKESLAYPKKKLLETFTEEQLKPASEIKLPYEYIRIDDLRKEES